MFLSHFEDLSQIRNLFAENKLEIEIEIEIEDGQCLGKKCLSVFLLPKIKSTKK